MNKIKLTLATIAAIGSFGFATAQAGTALSSPRASKDVLPSVANCCQAKAAKCCPSEAPAAKGCCKDKAAKCCKEQKACCEKQERACCKKR